MSVSSRLYQGFRALGAWARPVDDTRAARHLTPDQFALYRRMRRAERQHSLRVLDALLAGGHDDPDLLAAALLHDVGKIRTAFFLPEKVLVVLVKAFAPSRYWAWGSESAHGWRRPFAVSVQHPAWGAEMAAAAGSTPRTVELIRRHQDLLDGPPSTETDRLLRALQAVDDRS
ncbi:MAG TPA: HD domain-containing protein [Aggregatilinea sp.]|uniref:HD domain-containing protein n=1 Tax=Aggregatilinea sp. TaxID=2806333 RepID=UPI002BA7A90E|nr:HD domain-containing protein [Aggregatilinea sp.]HML24932.1 HD domain-containing protein [Aggregatilinea sp.]